MKIVIEILLLTCVITVSPVLAQSSSTDQEKYLSWSEEQAIEIGKTMRVSGKIGSRFAFRGLHTERAVNYKLRLTWLTPEVIRATARLHQIKNRLTDDQTRALVAEAEAAGDTVVMVELDPNEGSGIIPSDWRIFLQPVGHKPESRGAISGIKSPHLEKVKALSGVVRRNFDYDVFWVVFPLVDENKVGLLPDGISSVELMLGIQNQEERVTLRIPECIRARIKTLLHK